MFKALLATGRTSNLPTVWSNILIGHLIAATTFIDPPLSYSFPPNFLSSLITISLATSLLYLGGCFLGDAIDAKFDATHKPTRPIPSKILTQKSVLITATILLLAGVAVVAAFTHYHLQVYLSLALLLASIIAYSFLHKKSLLLGLPLIGACRFALILFGACAACSNFQLAIAQTEFYPGYQNPLLLRTSEAIMTAATVVGLYTICFASVARTESSKSPFSARRLIITLMLLLPLAYFLGLNHLHPYFPPEALTTKLTGDADILITIPLIAAYLIYWIWLTASSTYLKKNQKGTFVSMSLAGFCLLDATIAALFGWPYLLITLTLFALALLLQKFTPAT